MPPPQNDEEALEETRAEIMTLQNEYKNKKEELEIKERQRQQARVELERRLEKLRQLDVELQNKKPTIVADADEELSRVEQARAEYMMESLHDILHSRVALLGAEASKRHDPNQERERLQKDTKDAKSGEDNIKRHESVLISYYVNLAEDYKVVYRVDRTTTLEQLHRDACSYWGCSHRDYVLCMTTPEGEAKPLWEPSHEQASAADRYEKVQVVLDPAEKAQLHLVHKDDLEKFRTAREMNKDQEAKILEGLQAANKANDPNTIKTLKGPGFATNEVIAEPYVEACSVWPGLHTLLRNYKTQAHRDQKWTRLGLSDIIFLLTLLALSIVCHSLRNNYHSFELRNGAYEALVNGTVETRGTSGFMAFTDIKLKDQVWAWLDGVARTEIFNSSSTLRRFYTPVGFVRLRQQLAKTTSCAGGRNLPTGWSRTCYHTEVNGDTQDMETLQLNGTALGQAFFAAASSSGRFSIPDPQVWHSEGSNTVSLYGYMQNSYDGSGYSIVYNASSDGQQLHADLAFIQQEWCIDTARMLVLELTLANHNLGGYLSASFMLEIAPAGAVKPNLDLKGFSIYKSWRDDVAQGFDVTRWVLVVGYMLLWRFTMRSRQKVLLGKKRFSYLISPSGIADIILVGLFVASQIYHLKERPAAPETRTAFFSYESYAQEKEVVAILDATFILVCCIRLASFGRINPSVYRYVKVVSRSTYAIIIYCLMFGMVMCGVMALAHAVWSPYLETFSTYTMTISAVVLSIYHPFTEVMEMYNLSPAWTLPFLVYVVICIGMFMVHVFLAIIIHAYWEVELLEREGKHDKSWSVDQWLDWALWGFVYTKITGRKPGSSRMRGQVSAEEDSDSDSSSDSDEER